MGKISRWQARRRAKQELDAEEAFERKFAAESTSQKRSASLNALPQNTPISSESGLLYWCGGSLNDYVPIAEYGDPRRQRDLQAFALVAPMILNAEAVVLKKMQALRYKIVGGRNLSFRWRDIISNFENGEGWSIFIARFVRGFLESDRGGFAEIVRAVPEWAADKNGYLTDQGIEAMRRGDDAVWPIVGAATLDPVYCQFTQSQEFPLIYTNPLTGRRHFLRNYNFLWIVDMPSPSSKSGVCAVSRAVQAAQLDRYITRYYLEKISENPGAGIVFANAPAQQLETALKAASSERVARGVAFYKGLIFIPILNPDGKFGADFINFSALPDGFSHSETYNIVKEIVASAFGLDVLELGSIPGGNLGTATQAVEAAAKTRGKVLESLIAQIEREFMYKIMPETLNFSFVVQDQTEQLAHAQVNSVHFENAIRYATIAGPHKAEQYLVDVGAIPQEYIEHDVTDNVAISDVKPKTEKQFKPERGHLHDLTDADAYVSDEDVDSAISVWDDLFAGTEFVGILEAEKLNE